MMNNLLKAKHWQIFLFIYGLPLFYQIMLIGSTASSSIGSNKLNTETVLKSLSFNLLFVMISILLFLYWIWCVGIGLNNKLSKELKIRTGKFKNFLIIIALYFIIILLYIWVIMNSWISNNIFHTFTDNGVSLSVFILFFLFNVLVIFCFSYSCYFVAKTLKTAELQEKGNYSNYVGDFFLIWLFPIGIWFIQPRINNLFSVLFHIK